MSTALSIALILALALGAVAGLRSMMVPAVLSWACQFGALDLMGSWLGFLADPWAPWITGALALVELVVDKLPATPSRKRPAGFVTRLVMGAVAGAASGIATGATAGWALAAVAAGVLGAVAGTFGGAAIRARLSARLGRDRLAALIEDAVALAAAVAIIAAVP